jgi:hypothetical protein
MATSTLAALAPQVSERLQDDSNVFWSLDYEVYGGLAEGISELLLLVGRPTNVVTTPFSPAVNSVWNTVPSPILFITDVLVAGAQLKKTSLRSLDVTLASWGPNWESDRASLPKRWAPVGVGMFVLHPAPLTPITIELSGIEIPFTDPWPPTGAETSPFQTEFDQALQIFAAHYARIKEGGAEFSEGVKLYTQFLEIGQRMTTIQDRRDALVFTRSFGTPTAPSHVSSR